MTDRPNPLVMAELVRGLAECWLELDRELTRVDGRSLRGGSESKPPLNLQALDAKRAVDAFASTYVHMLIDETTWTPAALNTPHLLSGIALRIGHFTHHQDALIAYEFAEDVERVSREAWSVARPNGVARIPIGPCVEDGCGGRMRVTIDRDKPLDERSLALWQPLAMCDEDREHQMLARLYAEEVARV